MPDVKAPSPIIATTLFLIPLMRLATAKPHAAEILVEACPAA
jgi:hypothetical protein